MFQEIFKESVAKSREIREYLFIYEEAIRLFIYDFATDSFQILIFLTV